MLNTDSIVGKRVEIPCYYDLWMMGARYGVVKKIKDGKIHVKMDNPQVKKLAKFPVSDLEYFRI